MDTFSIISYHHIRVNIWAFESRWVGATNPKHTTAMSLKCVGSRGEGESVAFSVNQQKEMFYKQKDIYRVHQLWSSHSHIKNSTSTAGSPQKTHCRATTAARFQFVLRRLPPREPFLFKVRICTVGKESSVWCDVCSLNQRLQLVFYKSSDESLYSNSQTGLVP